MKDNVEAEAVEVLTNFKEFLLVFYGASWSSKSMLVSNAIGQLLNDLNPDEEHF